MMSIVAHGQSGSTATVSDDLAHKLFDGEVRRILDISGMEFVERYQAGKFSDIADDVDGRQIEYLIMLMPLARQPS